MNAKQIQQAVELLCAVGLWISVAVGAAHPNASPPHDPAIVPHQAQTVKPLTEDRPEQEVEYQPVSRASYSGTGSGPGRTIRQVIESDAAMSIVPRGGANR